MKYGLIVFIGAFLYSCDLSPAKNKFVIASVEHTDGVIATYKLRGVNGLGNGLWFEDSIKKFKVGDTVYLSLKK